MLINVACFKYIKTLKKAVPIITACLLSGICLHAESVSGDELHAAVHSSKIVWRRVFDEQGSSLEVPSNITQAYDGNELTFKSGNHELTVRLWTMTEERFGLPGHDPSGDMNLKRSDCDKWPPEYYKISNKLATYSCISQGKVRYYLAKYNKSGGAAMLAQYPKVSKNQWDAVISRMALSLNQVMRNSMELP